ncbi:ribosomal protein S27AE [Sinorhizobium kostiense]|uniref:Ribosomal protein S27AE n=1 Tax=Sinorhizobium kostiense TaxID=76747 RepID=A0ABS4QYX8_9HYPH|nr:hypothetical protein [Sinorhizobium kostiense]MBP2235230.1 ribosomal protein S27AE [Sinorhizobium kostiense]
MHLEIDIAIRRQLGDILPDDVALGVGDGWLGLVGRALLEIRIAAHGRPIKVTQVGQKRGSLLIHTDALAQRVPMAVADAIDEIRFNASDRSATTCERCGSLGFLIRGDEPRVRCGRCEATEVARQAIRQEYREHIEECCQYYIGVCIKTGKLLPVENVIVRVAPTTDEEHRILLDEVHERLVWWRAGSWIEGIDEALREPFRKLEFVRTQATADEWSAVRKLYPEDFVQADRHQALVENQRTRRATEIRSAALAYVRECAHKHAVLDIETFGQRRWRQDGVVKRRIMIDALSDDIRSGIPVVDVWRRFEVSGRIARRLVGAQDYTALYDILDRNGMDPSFMPRDVAAWVREGKMTAEDGMDILGIEHAAEFEDLVARWLAGED